MTPWLRSVWGLALVQAAACAAATAPPKFELVRFSDGILGYYPARVGERELVRHYATQAAATGLPLDERIRRVRTYLDVLLNFDTDRAEQHLQGPYSVFGSKTPGFFSLSKNWRWAAKPCPGGGLAHASADGKPHTATGVCRHIIRSGCVLRQRVYLDPAQPPSEISVGFTVPLFRYAGYKNRRCRVRWGGAPIRVRTDNTPFDFYAGPLPEKGKWVTLEVPAVDIGLGGMRRVFYGVSFQAPGGKALFGPTVFRWPELALCTSGDLGILRHGEPVEVRAWISNDTQATQPYTLAYAVYDLEQNRIHSGTSRETLRAGEAVGIELAIPRKLYQDRLGDARSPRRPHRGFLTIHATLTRPGATAKARTTVGFILPNRTGKQPDSPFGAMLWDRPASTTGAALYRDAGVKLVSINPGRVRGGEGPLLSQYGAHDMFVHSRIWDLAFVSAKDARAYTGKGNPLIPKLTAKVRGLGPMGSRFVSNFWEVDLRTMPETFGLNARYFRDAVRAARPDATVGTGGLAGLNIAWLDRMLASGGAGHVDFVQCMAYFTPSPPERSGIFEELRALREVFRRRGAPKTQVWISESSYFDHLNLERPELGSEWINSGVSRDLISPYMIRHALTCLAAGAAKVLPNAPFQPCRRPLRQTYGHTMTGCSSHRHDYTPLPLYFAWSVLTRHVEGKVFRDLIDCGPGVYCARFDAVNDVDDAREPLDSSPCVLALWSEHAAKPVSIHVAQERVRVMNFVGDLRMLEAVDGTVTLAATPRPRYLLLGTPPRSVRAVPPILAPLTPQCEVTHGEAAEVRVGLRVANPTSRPLRARLVFEAPNWCTSGPADTTVEVGPGGHKDVHFTVRVPKDNGDRIHYEMADLVARAEHYLAFGLLDGKRRIGTARVQLLVRPPLEVTLRPRLETRDDQERPKLLVRLRNRSRIARTGTVELRTKAKLEIEPRSQPFRVAPGKEAIATFAARGARVRLGAYAPKESGYCHSFGIGEGYVVEAIATSGQGDEARQSRGFAFFPAVRAKAPPKVDGRDGDWADAVWFRVEPSGRINALPFFCSVHSHKKEDVSMYFKGRSDLSARWAAKWDASHLYLFFRVTDDTFHQPNVGDMLWNGDSVRFLIDPLPDQTDAGIQPVARDPSTLLVFDAALTPRGPRLYRPYRACGLARGPVTSAAIAVARRKDGASYELAIPWRELGPLRPSRGGWMQMSVVFHDSDGHGRKTWINWFGGLAGVAREPRLLGDVHFVE